MSVGATVVVVSNDFPRISSQFDNRVQDALDTAILDLEEVAVPATPVGKTGFLRSNHTADGNEYSRTETWNQDYAAYVALGTVKMPARNFAQEGMDYAGPRFIDKLKKAVD